MKLAIQTSRLPGDDLAQKFQRAAGYGFDGVEVSIGPAFDLADHFSEVRDAVQASGLPCTAICTHSMHDPLQPDPGARARRFARLTELVRMADELGAEGVISVPVRKAVPVTEFIGGQQQIADLAAEEFARWSAGLSQGRTAVFLEPLNRYEAYFLRRVEQAVGLAQRIDSPRVLALADLFHMNIEESDMGAPIRAAGAWLGYVHIADNNRLQPGAGCLDFGPSFSALKEIGYEGVISIECTDLGGPLAVDGVDAMLSATVQFVREQWSQA